MKNLKLNSIILCMLGMFIALQLISSEANAVAFKLKNSTQNSVRAKVFDRGAWRNYVVVNPGQCVDIATSVERTEHAVVIQMKTSDGWKTIYKDNHGSRMFTRIVRISETNSKFYFAWYDEPHGCRDCPSANSDGCLWKSHWANLGNAVKVGEFIGKAVMKAEGNSQN